MERKRIVTQGLNSFLEVSNIWAHWEKPYVFTEFQIKYPNQNQNQIDKNNSSYDYLGDLVASCITEIFLRVIVSCWMLRSLTSGLRLYTSLSTIDISPD